jgi:hypothetical protein
LATAAASYCNRDLSLPWWPHPHQRRQRWATVTVTHRSAAVASASAPVAASYGDRESTMGVSIRTRASFSSQISNPNSAMQKEDSHHIKIPIHA